MEFTVGQIAEVLSGTVEGDAAIRIDRLAKIEEAQAGSLAFLANAKYEPHLYTTGASAIIVSKKQALRQPVTAALIRVDDPYLCFSRLLEFYQQTTRTGRRGVEEPAFLGPTPLSGKGTSGGFFLHRGRLHHRPRRAHLPPRYHWRPVPHRRRHYYLRWGQNLCGYRYWSALYRARGRRTRL